MLFGNPRETKFDLNFRLLRFPVRVSPMFWIAAILISPGEARDLNGGLGPAPLFIWIGVFFVSILLHELGHGLMFRRYRVRSHVVLHGFGGYASPDGEVYGHWRNIAVALAGPAVNFLIALAAWLSNRETGWAFRHEYLLFAYPYLYFANLFWGLFNLLPIWPLDGGRVCREVCHLAGARQPEQLSLKIGIGTAGVLLLLAVMSLTGQLGTVLRPVLAALPEWFPSHLFLMLIPGRGNELMLLFLFLLGYACWEELQRYSRGRYFYDDDR